MSADMGGFPAVNFPVSSQGTYANRPAASMVAPGHVYYATDVYEGYRSDGATWTVIPCGGTELGYAELTSTFSTGSTSFVDVTGMSITCKVGERPLMLRCNGVGQSSTASVNSPILGLIANGVQIAEWFFFTTTTNGYAFFHREMRISTLTPGTTYTFKLQLAAGAGTASVIGGGNDNGFLQLLTT